MPAKYELSATNSGQFMFNLKAPNGQVILTSEQYTAKPSARNGIESVRSNSPLDERYQRRQANNGSPYFVLRAANAKEIGRSEMYSSAAAMENGIASVKTNGPVAEVIDTTLA